MSAIRLRSERRGLGESFLVPEKAEEYDYRVGVGH